MALKLYDTLNPSGDFPLVEAKDVKMPDGTRLSDLSVSYPLETAETNLQPEHYYSFGEVDNLSVTLVEVDDNKAHEYYFEFIPTEDFTELTVTPTPKWVKEPQYPAGRTCQVSILRGIGVMVSA